MIGMDGVDLIVLLGKLAAVYCGLMVGWHLGNGFQEWRGKKRWTNWRRKP